MLRIEKLIEEELAHRDLTARQEAQLPALEASVVQLAVQLKGYMDEADLALFNYPHPIYGVVGFGRAIDKAGGEKQHYFMVIWYLSPEGHLPGTQQFESTKQREALRISLDGECPHIEWPDIPPQHTDVTDARHYLASRAEEVLRWFLDEDTTNHREVEIDGHPYIPLRLWWGALDDDAESRWLMLVMDATDGQIKQVPLKW